MGTTNLRIQTFLTLMDTIHDYGDVSRAMGIFKRKGMEQIDGVGLPEEGEGNNSFNTAVLIDFLMLGYMHDEFRHVIGTDLNQSYISKVRDCERIGYRNPNASNGSSDAVVYRSDPLARGICERFYVPTYVERVMFRSSDPENIAKDILFDHLKVADNFANPPLVDLTVPQSNARSTSKCAMFLLGNKGPGEKETQMDVKKFRDIRSHTIPEQYLYKRNTKDAKKGDLKKDFRVFAYDCLEEKGGKVVYKAKQKTGIYTSDDPMEQGIRVYDQLKKFLRASKITYVTDANSMDKEWFKVSEGSHYAGIFCDYDSYKEKQEKKPEKQNGGNNSNSNDDNVFAKKKISYKVEEFQEYGLSKQDGELLFLENLKVKYNRELGEYQIFHRIQNNDEKEINTIAASKPGNKDPKGISLFFILFNEINKKTLGFKQLKSIENKKANDIISHIHDIGMKSLETTYNITLKLKEPAKAAKTNVKPNAENSKKEDTGLVPLSPEEFILALFDFKRSMDYLYVKACQSANASAAPNHRYVFVSNDRSACLYSILLGNPTILTPPVVQTEDSEYGPCQRGSHYIVVYDPERPKTNANNANALATKLGNMNLKRQNNAKQQNNTKPKNNADANAEDDDNEIVANIRETAQRVMGILSPKIQRLEVQDPKEYIKKRCEQFRQDLRDPSSGSLTNPSFGINNETPNRFYRSTFFDDKGVLKRNKASILEKKKSFCRDIGVQFDENSAAGPSGVTDAKPKNANAPLPDPKGKGKAKATAKKTVQKGGTNQRTFLDQTIPLTEDLDNICEPGSPFYVFLHFYGQLSPEMPFFWFIVFETLFYTHFGDDMNRADCQVFEEMKAQNANNNTNPRNSNAANDANNTKNTNGKNTNIARTPYRLSRSTSLLNNTTNSANTGSRPVSGMVRALSTNNSYGFPPRYETQVNNGRQTGQK